MLARQQICLLQRQDERFQWHQLVVIEKPFAHAEKILLSRDSPNLVEKFSGAIHPQTNEVQVFLHLLHLGRFANVRRADSGIKQADVLEEVMSTRDKNGHTAVLLANLMEQPRIANGATTDHQAASAG